MEKPITKKQIVEANVAKLRRAMSAEIKYPEVRDLFGPTKVMTSFSHAIPDIRSVHVWGNTILNDVVEALDLPDEAVANIAYDNANPTTKNIAQNILPNYPGDHRLGLGDFPTILDAQIPIAFQTLKRSINFKQIKALTLSAFGGSSVVEERIDRVLDLMSPLQRDNSNPRPAVPAILEVRKRILTLLLGVSHVPETPFSDFRGRMVHSLMVLDHTYGKPFYTMPLGDFQEAGCLKGVTSKGERRPMHMETEQSSAGFIPIFSFDTADGQTVFRGDEIYGAMAEGKAIPTVPTMVLALTAGPQIAHMGGQDWKRYAPTYLPLLADWLGIPPRDAESLILNTEGRKPYTVKYSDKDGYERVSAHFSMGYVTLGPHGIGEALRKDENIEGKYGTPFDIAHHIVHRTLRRD